ncbi:hypothetical protein ILUMI_02695 [Ignelater luminosus]|uniref:Galactosylgalactosylxylosylprotein 3-beta-glucuronosyltransferase n=1 Tax=Ignelater luminosus TaxID=2038154 RepID=A0A8K0DNB0_IGNLU|nr:hypothetical protein ILUMI_02695 [Ignelater luminosus]
MRLILKIYITVVVGTAVFLYQYVFKQLHIPVPITLNGEHDQLETIAQQIAQSGLGNTRCKRICFDSSSNSDLPPLYIITPTYRRAEQIAELTRLAHTLMLVPNVYWLVIEDASKRTPFVTQLLEDAGIRYEHLLAPMPDEYKNKKSMPKGVSNRNKGLSWIRSHATEGVLYFADDDNTYDLDIFCQMRFTKRVSMWPVGLITKLGVSSPVVKNGVFSGFYDGWIAGRKFPVDMAGFAVSVRFLLQRPNASMPFRAGYEEDGFLRSLHPFEPNEIELLASNCSKILVWHTQTKKNQPSQPLDVVKYGSTNIAILKQLLV